MIDRIIIDPISKRKQIVRITELEDLLEFSENYSFKTMLTHNKMLELNLFGLISEPIQNFWLRELGEHQAMSNWILAVIKILKAQVDINLESYAFCSNVEQEPSSDQKLMLHNIILTDLKIHLVESLSQELSHGFASMKNSEFEQLLSVENDYLATLLELSFGLKLSDESLSKVNVFDDNDYINSFFSEKSNRVVNPNLIERISLKGLGELSSKIALKLTNNQYLDESDESYGDGYFEYVSIQELVLISNIMEVRGDEIEIPPEIVDMLILSITSIKSVFFSDAFKQSFNNYEILLNGIELLAIATDKLDRESETHLIFSNLFYAFVKIFEDKYLS